MSRPTVEPGAVIPGAVAPGAVSRAAVTPGAAGQAPASPGATRPDARRSLRRTGRIVKAARADPNGLGGRHLGVGLVFSGGSIAVFLFWRFVVQLPGTPSPLPSLAAWLILLIATVFTVAVVQRSSTRMPPWLFTFALITGAVVVILDLAGSAGRSYADVYPTAAPAVGALLTGLVTLREPRDVLAATGVLGVLTAGAALLEDRASLLTLAPEILSIALGIVPPVLGVIIVRSFRRMVELELDLVLVQSTVSQPRYAVGMLASEELARLDLDAETLLDDVAQGRTPLPLAPETSSTAASLATQLRLHLINGRTETWLHHAVTESEFLGPSVTVQDPSGLAGLLAPSQRDALLLTIWLLISDTARTASTVSLTLGPISPTHGTVSRKKVRFPIELMTTGVPRRRVDPETWQAIRIVGPHVDTIRDGSLRVDIECSVDNPADA
ncbi:hypothetical protein SAMN05216282_1078 [Cryobacterium psychrotolerans]|uniref:Uncharacterized protein n=1 Tax=Cryobacterium psychrotolerans TaxID=386301 RepID=A0A1G9CCY1_9MICO|nr:MULTISPECIES: hypothetical protein [Cryobacterium]TFD43365.1 hypothetical protein E3T33_10185 [Cryobacterium sp. TMT1-2-1]TFD84327.1 hypothetical protein E3T56_11610 [Cryobacterium psychrotolerans]SDK49304.1 hypothetical protein SAMN05216282_1078 [Cryobacterium psychrotolerans]